MESLGAAGLFIILLIGFASTETILSLVSKLADESGDFKPASAAGEPLSMLLIAAPELNGLG